MGELEERNQILFSYKMWIKFGPWKELEEGSETIRISKPGAITLLRL